MQLTLLYSFTSPGLFVESCWHLFAGRAWQPQVAVRGPGRVTFLRCAAIAAAWSALSACPCMWWSEQLPAQLPVQLLGLLLFGEICCAGGWPGRVRLARAPVPGAAAICAGLAVLVFSRRLPVRGCLCMRVKNSCLILLVLGGACNQCTLSMSDMIESQISCRGAHPRLAHLFVFAYFAVISSCGLRVTLAFLRVAHCDTWGRISSSFYFLYGVGHSGKRYRTFGTS